MTHLTGCSSPHTLAAFERWSRGPPVPIWASRTTPKKSRSSCSPTTTCRSRSAGTRGKRAFPVDYPQRHCSHNHPSARAAVLAAARAGGWGGGGRAVWPWRLVGGADDLEVRVDEDVVWPVDADVVDLVVAVAQFHHAVDDAAGVDGQSRFGRLVRGRSAGERPRSLRVVRRDRADRLGGALLALLVGDRLPSGGRYAGAGRLHDDLGGRDGRAVGRP